MSDQDPRSRTRRRRPATVKDALGAIEQAGRYQNARLLEALAPVRDQARSAHAVLEGIATTTDELIGTGPYASGSAPAIADPPAPDLDEDARTRIEKAWAAAESENTRRAYRSQWRRFAAFCLDRGEPALPAHPATVADYLTARAEQGVKVPTLRQAAAAIAHVHVHQDRANPCANAGVTRVLKGLAREHGTPAGQARGLTEKDLAAIRASARRPRRGPKGRLEKETAAMHRGDLDVALIGSMRDGLLRRSEAAAIRWGDLAWAEDGSGRLLLGRSKTDQEGRGHTAYVADVTMADLERIRPPRAKPEDRIFALSASQISRRIAAAARAAGLGEGYSGHSPRVGMTVDLVAAGFSLAELMREGRWRSPVMPAYYARNQLSDRGAVARFHASRASETSAEADELLRPEFGAGTGRPFDEPPPADFPVFGP
ncbi:MAG: hypothetical protein F4Z31_07775 [Gemmatimonadetes bacterium]|nr:hypothetical protein [Gemmatimonadota bacterium]